jgi:drug/metabolite transporter (DMT)-like permease
LFSISGVKKINGVYEMKRKLALLILSTLMWGIIPWPAANLFKEYSIFLVAFSRFLMMGIVLLGIVTIMLVWSKIQFSIKNANKTITQNSSGQVLSAQNLFKYLKSRNEEFFSLPQWLYLIIVAIFGMSGNIVLFFWGLKTLGAIITSIGYIIALIFVTTVNWGTGKEDVSNMQILYLITLFASMIIIGIIGLDQNQTPISFADPNTIIEFVILIGLYSLSLGFLLISTGADRLNQSELNLLRSNPQYSRLRIFFKIGFISIASAILLIPELFIINFLPLSPDITSEISNFLTNLGDWWELSITMEGIILIFICTIIPYMIYFNLALNWPKNTSFDLWAGVIQILEPIVNILIGIVMLNEVFPTSWLIMVIFLMLIAIITRYLSETESQILGILLLNINPKHEKNAMNYCFHLRSVRTVESLIGEHDIICQLRVTSQKALNKLIQEKIRKIPGLCNYEIIYITGTKLDKTVIGTHKKNRKFRTELK